jgi:hypothetical protein
MKKLTKYQLKKVSDRLENLFNLASDSDIKSGISWYGEANGFCQTMRAKYGIDERIVASVVSALSPRNKWATNLKDAENVIKAHKNNVRPEDMKVSTFHSNKFKAFALLDGKLEITNDSRKTFAFVKNVGELDESRVTVDVWHLRACFGKTIETGVGKLAYDQIEKLTIKKACEVGLKGFEYQAIIWLVAQKNF